MKNKISSNVNETIIPYVEKYMRALKIISVCMLAAALLTSTACSSSDRFPFFQNNIGNTNPMGGGSANPFAGLPDNVDQAVAESPVALIAEAFNPGTFNLTTDATDYQGFADRMETIRVDHQTAVDEVLYKFDDIANDATYGQSGRGIYGLIGALHNIMGYIVNQDTLDDGGASIGYGTSTLDLYAYLLKLQNANLNIKDDVYNIMYKNIRYLDVTYDDTTTNTIMTDLIAFLSDNTGQTVTSLFINLQEALGKMLMRAESYISYDDPLDWDGSGSHDIGLGNSMIGNYLLLTAVNNMVSSNNTYDAAAVRGDLYGILREAGKLMNGGGTFKDKFKQLLCNIEDYYTTGGSVYSVNADYNHPLAGSPAYYVNAELRNSLKELWPGLVKLFIRERDPASAPDYSIIHQTNGTRTRSPIEWLARGLGQLKTAGIDYSVSGNELEPSLKRMVEYNGFGTTRASNFKVSFLDHLLFTIAGGYTFGYLTRNDSTGEPYANSFPDSGSWGHGNPTKGILTLNDSLYSLTTNSIHVVAGLGLINEYFDSYRLALANRLGQGPHNWRKNAYSSQLLHGDAKGAYEFYIGKDYPDLLLLPPSCIGDAGIPTGGQKAVTPNSNDTTMSAMGSPQINDFRTWYPKAADGKGDLNTGRWMLGWIARVCWDGAGPYYSTAGGTTTSFNWPGKGTRNVYVYYKPNGEVYAYVYKDGLPSSPWEYFYPSSLTTGIGNDAEDPDDSLSTKQRFNRFRDVCRSDWYLLEAGHTGNYVAPPMQPNGTGYYDTGGGRGKYYLHSDANHDSSYFQLYEKVQEWTNTNIDDPTETDSSYFIIGNQNRECSTQEEAIFRNYQWLLLEKKFMFTMPMNLYWMFNVLYCINIPLDSATFVLIEANGLVGLATAKKGTANGVWNIKNTEGVGTNAAAPADHKNNPDYGDSLRPGDSRIVTFAQYFTNVLATQGVPLDPNAIFNMLGAGNVMPNAVGSNISPVARLGFLEQNYVMSTFSTSSGSWTSRNKILPLFAALAGSLMDGTYYDRTGESGNNYNYSASARHKYPLTDLMEGVMIPLAKPLYRYFNDKGGRWVPRMEDETRGVYSYFTPMITGQYTSANQYRPLNTVRTLTSFLAGNADNAVDGLLPLMADNTRIATRLLSLLQRLGNKSTGSPYLDTSGGGLNILSDFSQGLEQVVTSIQVDQGETIVSGYNFMGAGRSDTALSLQRYGWMFHTGSGSADRRAGTPISIDLKVALDELVGDNTKGLSRFVDDRGGTYNAAGWANYNRLFDAMAVMMGDNTSPYYILDDAGNTGNGGIIGILNKFLTGTTANAHDIVALQHTLGILMTRYQGGSWRPTASTPTNSDLYQILKVYLPDILNAYNRPPTNEFHYLLTALVEFMNTDGNLATMEPDNLNFMIDLLVKGETPHDIIANTYDLLGRDALLDPAYYSGGYPGHNTFKELANILETLANRL